MRIVAVDFNRRPSGHLENVSRFFVGVTNSPDSSFLKVSVDPFRKFFMSQIINQPIDKPEGHEPLGPELVAEGPVEWQSSINNPQSFG